MNTKHTVNTTTRSENERLYVEVAEIKKQQQSRIYRDSGRSAALTDRPKANDADRESIPERGS